MVKKQALVCHHDSISIRNSMQTVDSNHQARLLRQHDTIVSDESSTLFKAFKKPADLASRSNNTLLFIKPSMDS